MKDILSGRARQQALPTRPVGTTSANLSALEPGDIVHFEGQAWRVISTGTRNDLPVIVVRPIADDPTWTASKADVHLAARQKWTTIDAYPFGGEHLPVCGHCGGPWPCEILRTYEQLDKEMERAQRYSIPGVCPACSEPVTTRHTRQTWKVNLYGFPPEPVTFHLRQKCIDEARRYDEAIRKAGHPSQLGYQGGAA